MTWNADSLPDQTGRVVLVTGANAGLGFWTSLGLAGAGAEVILGCRSATKAQSAMRAIRVKVPEAKLRHLALDTSSLDSVRAAGEELASFDRLDGLVANAGIVHYPKDRRESVDRNELVFATNVLGHAALLAEALPVLERTATTHDTAPRVVLLGSLATLLVRFRLDDLQLRDDYSGWQAYGQSKIALSSLGFELDRRLTAAHSTVRSLVAHPGYSVNGLDRRVPGVNEPTRQRRFNDTLQSVYAQSKQRGAEPILRAMTDVGADGGWFFGPRWVTKGDAVRATPAAVTTDPDIAAGLWTQLEMLVGKPLLPNEA
ncbi:MAG TPA: SDR family NAD(P)-dependent oxidoreductase [Plantibacter sp.]|uniref:SDR family NAD(P)-dependent oxidoreductase n=1 Tax=unclassified Plantibacter TaxID=2624265 RepID=UPI002C148A35|nr:SDR family NAD(P)-dependent oxidoreductase [Plantibacter sp.]